MAILASLRALSPAQKARAIAATKRQATKELQSSRREVRGLHRHLTKLLREAVQTSARIRKVEAELREERDRIAFLTNLLKSLAQ